MGEWDALESRLKDLGEEAARLVSDPLDPARVRRLADRRRLRRSVAAVLIAVAILIFGGVGVYAVTSQPEPHHAEPGRRSHQHANPQPRAVGGAQRLVAGPGRHLRARRRSAAGSADLPVEQPVLP